MSKLLHNMIILFLKKRKTVSATVLSVVELSQTFQCQLFLNLSNVWTNPERLKLVGRTRNRTRDALKMNNKLKEERCGELGLEHSPRRWQLR